MSQDYFVECYCSDRSEAAVSERTARIASITEELTADGRFIVLLGSVLVASDEVCFWRFRSASIAEIEEVARRSGIGFDRVTPSIDVAHPTSNQKMPGRTP
ncbi:MAG TPA: hypothetical protein VES40_20090 [Ilumatobacteraceae bacterium]|nr:hypothetical protein [Ilumatobacteraceae bacterium]